MKIVILLITCMGFLNFTSATLRGVGGFHDNIPDQSQIYLQLPGDRVLTGVLRNIGRRIPGWVLPPRGVRYNYRELVYVRFSDGHGLSSNLNETVHFGNDESVNGIRCYIPIQNNVVLTSFLEPYNFNPEVIASPRIFVRLPLQRGIVYTGVLHRGFTFPANIFH